MITYPFDDIVYLVNPPESSVRKAAKVTMGEYTSLTDMKLLALDFTEDNLKELKARLDKQQTDASKASTPQTPKQ